MVSMSLLRSIRSMITPAPARADRALHFPETLCAPRGMVAIRLRTMGAEDLGAWNAVRARNASWLAPWESGDPQNGGGLTFQQWLQRQRRDENEGTAIVLLIEFQMRIVGQISLGAITYGSMRTGVVGYWVAQDAIGHGIAPTAVAMLADWALHDDDGPHLHRLEIAIVPCNDRSLRVVAKLEAHREGLRPGYMYVDGQWRDHLTFSLLAEDAPQGFATRLLGRHA